MLLVLSWLHFGTCVPLCAPLIVVVLLVASRRCADAALLIATNPCFLIEAAGNVGNGCAPSACSASICKVVPLPRVSPLSASGSREADVHTEEPDEHPGRDADDEIEHGPLPLSLRPPSRHNAAAARWLRQSVTLPRPVVAAGVLALVVLALLVLLPGSGGQLVALVVHPAPTATATPFGGPTSVPVTPTPSPFPTPTPVAPPLGAIPTDCSPSPTGPVVGGFGGTQPIYAVGTGPVWVDGFDRTTAIISITQDQTGPYDEYGWPVFTALAMKAPFEQVVTLQGKDPRTGAPLWFSLGSDSQGGAAPLMTVDPQQGFHSGGGGAIWYNGMMYLPGAGCYTLQASWAGGGWQITFAAGQ